MATLKSLLESLLSIYTRKTELSSELSNYVLKADTEWIGHQSLPQATQTEYKVSNGDSVTAPFDGTACLLVDGATDTAIKNARISSRNIYSTSYSSNNIGMRYVRIWVPIVKGAAVGVSFDGGTSATLRCNPTIGSS